MALLEKYSILLRWWLFFTIASLGTVALFLSGVMQQVNQVDVTKISFLIYAVFAIFTMRTGIDTYHLSREDKVTNQHIAKYYKKSDTGWFVSDSLVPSSRQVRVVGEDQLGAGLLIEVGLQDLVQPAERQPVRVRPGHAHEAHIFRLEPSPYRSSAVGLCLGP